jgi:hypothetical protein
MKNKIATYLMVTMVLILTQSLGFSVNTITHVETLSSKGAVITSSGGVPSAGGVTIGYFSVSAPNDSVIQSWTADTAVSSLLNSSYGWVDLRTVSGGSMQSTGDWDWPGGGSPGTAGAKIGGTLNWVYDASKTGVQLYLFAFNGGSSGFGYSGTTTVAASSTAFTSSSFTGSTEWAALRATNWLLPGLDGTALELKIADVDTSGELIVGTDSGDNSYRDIRMSAVPEPSTGALMMIGAVGLVALRRLRKV